MTVPSECAGMSGKHVKEAKRAKSSPLTREGRTTFCAKKVAASMIRTRIATASKVQPLRVASEARKTSFRGMFAYRKETWKELVKGGGLPTTTPSPTSPTSTSTPNPGGAPDQTPSRRTPRKTPRNSDASPSEAFAETPGEPAITGAHRTLAFSNEKHDEDGDDHKGNEERKDAVGHDHKENEERKDAVGAGHGDIDSPYCPFAIVPLCAELWTPVSRVMDGLCCTATELQEDLLEVHQAWKTRATTSSANFGFHKSSPETVLQAQLSKVLAAFDTRFVDLTDQNHRAAPSCASPTFSVTGMPDVFARDVCRDFPLLFIEVKKHRCKI